MIVLSLNTPLDSIDQYANNIATYNRQNLELVENRKSDIKNKLTTMKQSISSLRDSLDTIKGSTELIKVVLA